MKKYFTLMVAIVLIFAVTVPAFADATTASEIKFDISPFENSDNYTIEFDDMDDTCKISFTEDGHVVGVFDNDNGAVWGNVDVKIVENLPPVLRTALLYTGEDWIFIDRVIIKTSNSRYTFEVERDTDVSDGKIWEFFTLVFTDESIQMLQDIVDSNDFYVKCRLDGSSRDVDGRLYFNLDQIKELLDDYQASGALDNDFSIIKELCPCKVKQS